ncbi:putative LRR receptor-like serine/threonine-protein kinase [Dorcoceras hygrometricum]|uniref:Putative LRR receptor-like serine/threonine-protein kinase n=1 Tax=Dorcoceras hygrometricum TaxID=472368 RepID=A0A2Z7D5U3_9LAMI|nr:putative LRR receptor-like serine/threonine-protein kinase [Dorcoceras hygrometricum]
MPPITTSAPEDRATSYRSRPTLLSSGSRPRTRSEIGSLPEDSCSARETDRGLTPRSGVCPRTRAELGSTNKIPEDHGEYLARDIRCMRIFAKMCSSPSSSPSINTSVLVVDFIVRFAGILIPDNGEESNEKSLLVARDDKEHLTCFKDGLNEGTGLHLFVAVSTCLELVYYTCVVWHSVTSEFFTVISFLLEMEPQVRHAGSPPAKNSGIPRSDSNPATDMNLPGPDKSQYRRKQIPEWFGLRFASLRVLDLSYCLINGSIPFSLGNLSSLVALHLSGNNLSGTVPSNIGKLFGLSELDLSKNRLTGFIPETFATLRNLTLLDMSLNYLSGAIPPIIGTLSRLRFLNLSGNSFSSSIPTQLGDLASLVDLDLGSNLLSGPMPVNLRGLRMLQRIHIGNNSLSGSIPGNLFRPLTRLQFVVLSHNGFSSDFPNVLWFIPSLQFLDVSANKFTGVLPSDASKIANATVAVFNISENLFYGNLTPFIRRFRFIYISGNFFEGPVPVYAHGNTSLIRNCLRNMASQRNVTECASFYADRNLVFDNFGDPIVTTPPLPPQSKKKSHKSVIIFASIFGGIGIIAFVVSSIVLLIICTRRRDTTNQRGISVGPVPAGESPLPLGKSLDFSSLGDAFTYQQILRATSDFDNVNLIKKGHSGDIFRGILEGGLPVVIKRVDLHSSVRKAAYLSELNLFSKVSHPRFVPLLGHCLENENENEKFFVYKHMPYADLSSSLFKKKNSDEESLQSLDWITRLKNAIGAAEGLSYLHHECTPPLVHRTSDEGASGTPNASCAYDVYCFGKVLLELVTGKLGISSSTDATTKGWLDSTLEYIDIHNKELITNIADQSLIIDEDLLEEVWAMAIVARSCLNPKPNQRPLMQYILKALENPLKVVREENTSSAKLRTTSSRGSWNAALFGSWRHSSSDVAALPVVASNKVEGASSFKNSGTTGSQASGQNGDGNGHFYSTKRHS